MPRLCERPGCSAPADIAYGIEADRLVVWLETLPPLPVRDHRSGVLCRRHADSMVVPLGWTLDDRRDPTPRLFRPPPADTTDAIPRPRKRKSKRPKDEQLRLDEVMPTSTREPVVARLFETPPRTPRKPRTAAAAAAAEHQAPPVSVSEPVSPEVAAPSSVDDSEQLDDTVAGPWYPSFDDDDDLGGLLVPKGPLMARAFGNPQKRPSEEA